MIRALLLVVALLLWTTNARAHAMRTAYLEVVEHGPGVASMVLRLPVGSRDVWAVIEGCSVVPDEDATGFVTRAMVRCPGALAGREVRLQGLGPTVSDAAIRVLTHDGRSASQVLTPRAPSFVVPETSALHRVAGRYVVLGVEHILGGLDHLAFVVALFLLARSGRTLIVTASAFTLAHSVTLSATALGLLHVSSAWAEACIALSLVLAALDAISESKGTHPASLAFVFGLVHGLGFAGALQEVGLPKGATALALLGFNLGVELGQLAFIGVLVLLSAVLSRARVWIAHAIGSVGCAVFIARAVELWGGR